MAEEQELEDGLYSIRLAGQPGMVTHCVDVMGANDGRGNNVWLWTYYGGGGQIVSVTKQSDGYQIMFPLTGKVMDLQNGTVDPSQGATFNVFQWPFNGGGAQRWELVKSNRTAVVNGQTLTAYMICSKVDTSYCLTVQDNVKQDGKNLIVGTAGSALDTMYWVFAPVPSIGGGTYKIVPYGSENSVISISGHTNTNHANCCLEAPSEDSNWQVFFVDPLDDGTCSIRCAQNGKGLFSKRQNSANNTFRNGDYLSQTTWSAYSSQKWVIKYQGVQAKINGENQPLYRIINQWGDYQPCVDIYGSASKPQNIVRMWQMGSPNKDNAQLFWLVPTEAYGKSLAVPSSIQGYYSGEYGTLIGVDNSSAVYPAVQPSWVGTGEEWKVRYRLRYRKNKDVSAGTRSAWSAWKSIDDHTTSNNGWGVAGVANTTAVLGDGRWTSNDAPLTTAVGLGPNTNHNDLVQIEFQIRQLAHEWGDYILDAHSGAASQIVTLAYKPTLTFGNVTMDNNGVKIPYTTTSARKLSKLRIWSDGFFDVSASNNVAVSGTLTSKTAKSIPEDSVTIKYSITTVDGVVSTGSAICPVTISWKNAATMSVTESFNNESKLLVATLPSGVTDARCWLDISSVNSSLADYSLIEIDPVGNKVYIPYPFNKGFKVTIVGIVSGTLRKFEKTYSARTVAGRMWNFNNTDWCSGLLTLDGPPEESVSTKYTSDERPTTAGTWNRVSMGKVKSQTRNFSAVVADEFDEYGRRRVRGLADCKYSWYRNQEGEVCRVAIISVNETKRYWGEEFTVEMRRVDT